MATCSRAVSWMKHRVAKTALWIQKTRIVETAPVALPAETRLGENNAMPVRHNSRKQSTRSQDHPKAMEAQCRTYMQRKLNLAAIDLYVPAVFHPQRCTLRPRR